jgi:hypothetical protein
MYILSWPERFQKCAMMPDVMTHWLSERSGDATPRRFFPLLNPHATITNCSFIYTQDSEIIVEVVHHAAHHCASLRDSRSQPHQISFLRHSGTQHLLHHVTRYTAIIYMESLPGHHHDCGAMFLASNCFYNVSRTYLRAHCVATDQTF